MASSRLDRLHAPYLLHHCLVAVLPHLSTPPPILRASQGLEFLRQRMSREHDSQAVVEADLMLVAADTDDDIVFCLLEYKMQAGDSDQL